MTPERVAQIEAVITRYQAEGRPILPTPIYREVKGNKARTVAFVKAWLAAHPEAAPGTVVEEPAGAVPDEDQASPQGADCRLTDGLPEALPPAPQRAMPRLHALEQEKYAAQRRLEEAQRALQQVARAWQEARIAAGMALDQVRRASRQARSAPPQEHAAACQRVEEARDALAYYVGEQAAGWAEHDHGYVPTGLC